MKHLKYQKIDQSLDKLHQKGKEKNPAQKDVFVTRYITEWDINTRKMSTTVSGDQIIPRYN